VLFGSIFSNRGEAAAVRRFRTWKIFTRQEPMKVF